jgi:hypothetical protein
VDLRPSLSHRLEIIYMNIHPLTKHYSVLKQLPGVDGVNQLQTATGEAIEIQTTDAVQAQFLDDILADTIGESPVRFSFKGPEIGVAPKPFYPAEEILQDYSPLLKGLPGVSHLDTLAIKCGEWLPAFETAIEVVTDSKADSKFLSEILEPQVSGTKVLIRSEKQSFDEYGQLPGFSKN